MEPKVKLSERARLTRNEYLRIWRKNHPDNIREAQRKFWEHRAEKEAKAAQNQSLS